MVTERGVFFSASVVEGFFGSHLPERRHLVLGDVLLGSVEQEATDRRLVIFLTPDVTEEIDASEAATNRADRQLAKLQ